MCKRTRLCSPTSLFLLIVFKMSEEEVNKDILTEFKPFQESLEGFVVGPDGTYLNPDPREIVHVQSKVGDLGKSTYVKHLIAKHGAIMVDYRSPVDCKYIIAEKQEEINELGRAVVVVIDIPRSVSMDRAELYTLLECIKDGSFVSTKYKPKVVKLEKQPHVFVFSNNPLDVRFMSPDKFNCFIITSDFDLKKNEALIEKLMEEANKQREEQDKLEEGVIVEKKDDMDSLFEAIYEIDPDGPDDKPESGKRILVKEILATLKRRRCRPTKCT